MENMPKTNIGDFTQYLKDRSATNSNPTLDCSNFVAARLYWKFLTPFQFLVIAAVTCICLVSAIDAYLLAQIKTIVDNDSGILDTTVLISFTYLFVGMMIFRALIQFVGQYLFNYSENKLSVKLNRCIFEHIARMPQTFFDVNGNSAIVGKMQGAASGMTAGISGATTMLAKEGSAACSYLFLMFHTNWMLSSIILLILPVIALTLTITSKIIKNFTANSISKGASQYRLLSDMVRGQEVVRNFNAQEFERVRYYEELESIRHLGIKGTTVTGLGNTFIQIVASCLLACIIVVTAYATDLDLKPITPGDFVVIFSAMFGLLRPIRTLTNIQPIIVSTLTSTRFVFGMLALETEKDTGVLTEEEINFAGRIKYEDVTFAYPIKPDEPVLKNLNLEIDPNSTVALVGKSGSGKSTILSLLTRIYDVEKGEIKIDGRNIQDITLFALRNNIGVVTQNVHLFDDTIYNNIVYCDVGKYTSEQVHKAAQLAFVTNFTDHFPDGLQTRIGSEGTRLSGGQRQRIAIARALLRNKPILILDEATSALDNESEYFIQKALNELRKDRTVISIAHRLSTIENADKIYVIDNGQIIESGTHKELINNPYSEYSILYHRKFDNKKG